MIRILIVDASPADRLLIRSILESDQELTVVAEARNSNEAFAACRKLHPDLVTLDTALPNQLVYETVRQIMDQCPTPIFLLTDLTSQRSEAVSFNALALGALTVVSKPRGLPQEDPKAENLITQVKTLASVKVVRRSARL
jgi:two-component system, chemotaxis family, protein-glutamate methylesterase/glutaminase